MKKFNFISTIFSILFLSSFVLAQDTTLSVTSEGNVGIGTTSPAAKFHVMSDGGFGSPQIELNQIGDAAWTNIRFRNQTGQFWDIAESPSNQLRFFTGTGNRDVLTLTKDSNVGIGTLSPFSRLHVHSPDVTRADFSTASVTSPVFLRFFHSSNIQGGAIGFATSDNSLKLVHGGNFATSTNGITIKSNGTVGLGTTNPAGDLEVMDDEGSTTNIYFTAINDLVLGGTLGLRKARGTVSSPEDVQNGDRMGIIGGHGKSGFSYWSTGAIEFEVDGTFTSGQRPPSRITFNTNASNSGATERVRIDKDGNVGIGTSNPQGILDVNGTIYQRGGQLHADYVFEPEYQLETIDEHAKFMWNEKHLKAIPKATVDKNGVEIVEVGSHRKGIVEELEKAHIYIDQLNSRIKKLEESLEKIATRFDNQN